jgi:hypothetical protein
MTLEVIDLLLEELKAMDANEDVSVGVDFEEVAIERVKPETANGECWVVLEEENFWNDEREDEFELGEDCEGGEGTEEVLIHPPNIIRFQ